jgi:hypothetical protein
MFRTLLNSAVISLPSFPINGIVDLGSAIQRLRISPSFSSMSFLALCNLKDTDNSSGCLAVDCALRSNIPASLSVVSSGTDRLNERLGHFFLVRTDDWSRILVCSQLRNRKYFHHLTLRKFLAALYSGYRSWGRLRYYPLSRPSFNHPEGYKRGRGFYIEVWTFRP